MFGRGWQNAQKTGDPFPQKFFFTDSQRTPSFLDVVSRLNADTGVVFRNYSDPDRADKAAALGDACRAANLTLLVAGDMALARRVGASGVHLPEKSMNTAAAAHLKSPHWIISCACHSWSALNQAARLPIDLIFLSPVFPTQSHLGSSTLGPVRLARLNTEFRAQFPRSNAKIFALGGISKDNLKRLCATGINGYAGIKLFMQG